MYRFTGIFIFSEPSLMNVQSEHKTVKWVKVNSSKLWPALIFWPAYTVNFSHWSYPQSLLVFTSQISVWNNWEKAFRIYFQTHLLEVTFDLKRTVKAGLQILENYIIFSIFYYLAWKLRWWKYSIKIKIAWKISNYLVIRFLGQWLRKKLKMQPSHWKVRLLPVILLS